MFLKKSLRHWLHVATLYTIIVIYFQATGFRATIERPNPFELYGYQNAFLLYIIKLLTYLVTPVSLLNLLGITVYDAFRQDELQLRRANLLDPFISIRIVTKGDYPDLVKANVQKNIRICKELGLDKFIVEVVTDQPLNLPNHPRIREIVVPNHYKTKTDARFKARALQYALQDDVNMLGDDDWIVHLDEETLLTKSSMIGILNFLYENKHQIGQGSISYGKQEIVSWLATFADTPRVSSDYGVLRFCLKTFNRPLFSFKGSFVVCKASVERLVSFENGIKGSIAEDSYFAIQAVNHGFTFDWIDGQMLEKSPFSFWDFIKQRKRWVQGLYLLVNDKNIKTNLTKLGFTYSFCIWMMLPFQLINSIILLYFPISFSIIDDFLSRFNGIIFFYLFIFGALKSFYFGRYNIVRNLFCIFGSAFSIPYLAITESIAVIWGLFSDKKQFYVISKSSNTLDV